MHTANIGLYRDDVHNFVLRVSSLEGAALFDHFPHREYNAYCEYMDNNSKIRNPRKLGRHLKLSQKRDFDNHLADHPIQPDLSDNDNDENDDDNSDDGFDIHDNVILNFFSWILCMYIRRKCLCLYYIQYWYQTRFTFNI